MKKAKRLADSAKKVLSLEEHAKAKEERGRHFTLDIVDVGNDTYSVKSPILLSKDKLDLLKKICEITDEDLQQYIKEALFQRVQIDLESPSVFGQSVCETLLKQWGPVK